MLDKLKGPSKEEVWKHLEKVWSVLGYDKPFDTPEEFFENFKVGINLSEKTKFHNSVYWGKNRKFIFKLDRDTGYFYMCDELITIFRDLFDINYEELRNILYDFIGEQLNWRTFKEPFYPTYLKTISNTSKFL